MKYRHLNEAEEVERLNQEKNEQSLLGGKKASSKRPAAAEGPSSYGTVSSKQQSLSDEEMQELKADFDEIDVDKSGSVDVAECRALLQKERGGAPVLRLAREFIFRKGMLACRTLVVSHLHCL